MQHDQPSSAHSSLPPMLYSGKEKKIKTQLCSIIFNYVQLYLTMFNY
jgi:hypothetical protein